MFNHGVLHRGPSAHHLIDIDRISAAMHGGMRALFGSRTAGHSAPRYKEAYFESSVIDRERYRL